MNTILLINLKRALIGLLCPVMVMTNLVLPVRSSAAQAAPAGLLALSSASYAPVTMTGMAINPDNPLQLDFFMDAGDSGLDINTPAFKQESEHLVQYFLAALTVPEDQVWVNLDPDESDRIIAEGFDQTLMGRDLLAQDYILKQLTSSLMYPEEELGTAFWERVYAEAWQQFGTTEIPIDTFHKVWITPDQAQLYRHENNIFTVKNSLKVMLERDYVAFSSQKSDSKKVMAENQQQEAEDLSTGVMRSILMPAIQKEVNEGEHFAKLRQIYSAMILATWYKRNLKASLLGQVYVDENKTYGVHIDEADSERQRIYDEYVAAFKQGLFNYVKEEQDAFTQTTLPRHYFSGGATGFNGIDVGMVTDQPEDVGDARVAVRLDHAMTTDDASKRNEFRTQYVDFFTGVFKEFSYEYNRKQNNLTISLIDEAEAISPLLKELMALYVNAATLSQNEYRYFRFLETQLNREVLFPLNLYVSLRRNVVDQAFFYQSIVYEIDRLEMKEISSHDFTVIYGRPIVNIDVTPPRATKLDDLNVFFINDDYADQFVENVRNTIKGQPFYLSGQRHVIEVSRHLRGYFRRMSPKKIRRYFYDSMLVHVLTHWFNDQHVQSDYRGRDWLGVDESYLQLHDVDYYASIALGYLAELIENDRPDVTLSSLMLPLLLFKKKNKDYFSIRWIFHQLDPEKDKNYWARVNDEQGIVDQWRRITRLRPAFIQHQAEQLVKKNWSSGMLKAIKKIDMSMAASEKNMSLSEKVLDKLISFPLREHAHQGIANMDTALLSYDENSWVPKVLAKTESTSTLDELLLEVVETLFPEGKTEEIIREVRARVFQDNPLLESRSYAQMEAVVVTSAVKYLKRMRSIQEHEVLLKNVLVRDAESIDIFLMQDFYSSALFLDDAIFFNLEEMAQAVEFFSSDMVNNDLFRLEYSDDDPENYFRQVMQALLYHEYAHSQTEKHIEDDVSSQKRREQFKKLKLEYYANKQGGSYLGHTELAGLLAQITADATPKSFIYGLYLSPLNRNVPSQYIEAYEIIHRRIFEGQLGYIRFFKNQRKQQLKQEFGLTNTQAQQEMVRRFGEDYGDAEIAPAIFKSFLKQQSSSKIRGLARQLLEEYFGEIPTFDEVKAQFDPFVEQAVALWRQKDTGMKAAPQQREAVFAFIDSQPHFPHASHVKNVIAQLSGQSLDILYGIVSGRKLTRTRTREIWTYQPSSVNEIQPLIQEWMALNHERIFFIDDSPTSKGYGDRRIRSEILNSILHRFDDSHALVDTPFSTLFNDEFERITLSSQLLHEEGMSAFDDPAGFAYVVATWKQIVTMGNRYPHMLWVGSNNFDFDIVSILGIHMVFDAFKSQKRLGYDGVKHIMAPMGLTFRPALDGLYFSEENVMYFIVQSWLRQRGMLVTEPARQRPLIFVDMDVSTQGVYFGKDKRYSLKSFKDQKKLVRFIQELLVQTGGNLLLTTGGRLENLGLSTDRWYDKLERVLEQSLTAEQKARILFLPPVLRPEASLIVKNVMAASDLVLTREGGSVHAATSLNKPVVSLVDPDIILGQDLANWRPPLAHENNYREIMLTHGQMKYYSQPGDRTVNGFDRMTEGERNEAMEAVVDLLGVQGWTQERLDAIKTRDAGMVVESWGVEDELVKGDEGATVNEDDAMLGEGENFLGLQDNVVFQHAVAPLLTKEVHDNLYYNLLPWAIQHQVGLDEYMDYDRRGLVQQYLSGDLDLSSALPETVSTAVLMQSLVEMAATLAQGDPQKTTDYFFQLHVYFVALLTVHALSEGVVNELRRDAFFPDLEDVYQEYLELRMSNTLHETSSLPIGFVADVIDAHTAGEYATFHRAVVSHVYRLLTDQFNDQGMTAVAVRTNYLNNIESFLQTQGVMTTQPTLLEKIKSLSTQSLAILNDIVKNATYDDEYNQHFTNAMPTSRLQPLIREWVALHHDQFVFYEQAGEGVSTGFGDQLIRSTVLTSMLKAFPDAQASVSVRHHEVMNWRHPRIHPMRLLTEVQPLPSNTHSVGFVWGFHDDDQLSFLSDYPEVMWIDGGNFFPQFITFLGIVVPFRQLEIKAGGFKSMQRLASLVGVDFDPFMPEVFINDKDPAYKVAVNYFKSMGVAEHKSERSRPVLFVGLTGGKQDEVNTERPTEQYAKGFTDMHAAARLLKQLLDDTEAMIFLNREQGYSNQLFQELMTFLGGLNPVDTRWRERVYLLPQFDELRQRGSAFFKYIMWLSDAVVAREGGTPHLATTLGIPTVNLVDPDVLAGRDVDVWLPRYAASDRYREVLLSNGTTREQGVDGVNGFDAMSDEEMNNVTAQVNRLFDDQGMMLTYGPQSLLVLHTHFSQHRVEVDWQQRQLSLGTEEGALMGSDRMRQVYQWGPFRVHVFELEDVFHNAMRRMRVLSSMGRAPKVVSSYHAVSEDTDGSPNRGVFLMVTETPRSQWFDEALNQMRYPSNVLRSEVVIALIEDLIMHRIFMPQLFDSSRHFELSPNDNSQDPFLFINAPLKMSQRKRTPLRYAYAYWHFHYTNSWFQQFHDPDNVVGKYLLEKQRESRPVNDQKARADHRGDSAQDRGMAIRAVTQLEDIQDALSTEDQAWMASKTAVGVFDFQTFHEQGYVLYASNGRTFLFVRDEKENQEDDVLTDVMIDVFEVNGNVLTHVAYLDAVFDEEEQEMKIDQILREGVRFKKAFDPTLFRNIEQELDVTFWNAYSLRVAEDVEGFFVSPGYVNQGKEGVWSLDKVLMESMIQTGFQRGIRFIDVEPSPARQQYYANEFGFRSNVLTPGYARPERFVRVVGEEVPQYFLVEQGEQQRDNQMAATDEDGRFDQLGGIDLDAGRLEIIGDGDQAMPVLLFDEALVAQWRDEIRGFEPVILSVQPITNASILLGL